MLTFCFHSFIDSLSIYLSICDMQDGLLSPQHTFFPCASERKSLVAESGVNQAIFCLVLNQLWGWKRTWMQNTETQSREGNCPHNTGSWKEGEGTVVWHACSLISGFPWAAWAWWPLLNGPQADHTAPSSVLAKLQAGIPLCVGCTLHSDGLCSFPKGKGGAALGGLG